jgi:hypothetical protein
MAKAYTSPAISRWGTPDPRDAAAYPKATSETPMTQWGWEFLRRCADYRARWQELVQPFIKDDDRWDFEAEDRERQAKGILYVSRLVSFGGEFEILPSRDNKYLDPRSGCPPTFVHKAIEIRGPVSSTAWFELPVMAFTFDVRSPPDPQFAYARQQFEEGAAKWSKSSDQQPPRKLNRHIQKYPTYLRLLDFKESRSAVRRRIEDTVLELNRYKPVKAPRPTGAAIRGAHRRHRRPGA